MSELLDLPLFAFGGRTFDAKLDAERLGQSAGWSL